MKNQMKNNINKYLKKCLIYPYNFLKFIRKINVKYLMNNNKNSIIDNNIKNQVKNIYFKLYLKKYLKNILKNNFFSILYDENK